MIYGSVCSGIEAATVAWHSLGWQPAFFAEIARFPSAVLRYHYPTVPNARDFRRIQHGDFEPIELLVGGTPCQDFSVAGLRAGMDGKRGQLTVEFARLTDRLRPRWLVWENVPGVLSIDGGRAFGAFLGILGQLGYGVAYRVLDAQYAGVPQRRRRVFIVGYLGDWRRAAAVLFERHSLSGYPAPRREAGQVAPCIPSRSLGGGGLGTDFDCDGGLICEEIAGCLSPGAHPGGFNGQDAHNGMLITHALRGEEFDASEDGTGRGTPLVAQTITADMYRSGGATAGNNPGVRNVLTMGMAVRRLTPRECERLQGFPDDYTKISGYNSKITGEFGGNRGVADGPRYKALGNSMAVPLMRWLGERILEIDTETRRENGNSIDRC